MSNQPKRSATAYDIDPKVWRTIKWTLDLNQINANNMIESIRLGNSSRAASTWSFVRIALVALQVSQHRACYLRLSIAPSQEPSKISVPRMTKIIMTKFDIGQL
eukprot:4420904-Pyramimonas_sp.AAC.1